MCTWLHALWCLTHFFFSIHWLTSLPSVFKHTVTPSMLSIICLPGDPWQQTQMQMSAEFLHPYSQSWSKVDCRQIWDVLTFMAGWAGRLSPRDSVYFQACVPVLLLRPPNMPQISWQETGRDLIRFNNRVVSRSLWELIVVLASYMNILKRTRGRVGVKDVCIRAPAHMLGLQEKKLPSTPDANESAIRNKRYIQTTTPVQ